MRNLILSALGIGYGGAYAALIPPIIAALIEGQKFARRNPAPLPGPWRQAFYMMLIGTGFFIVFMIASFVFSIGVDPETATTPSQTASVIVTLTIVYAVVNWVLSRIFYAWGAKGIWRDAV